MFRSFVRYYRNHLKLFLLDMSCATAIAIIDLSIPLMVKIFIDDAIPNNNYDLMKIIIIIAFIFLILSVVFHYIVSYYGHVMGTRIEKDMRQDLFEHFQKMDTKFFSEEQVGKLMSRLVGDLRDISEFSHHGPEDIFISFVMLIGSFIVLSTVNVVLTLILIVIVVIMVFFTRLRRVKMTKAFKKTREVHAELNSQIENSLSGISVVKAYTNEGYEKRRFANANNTYQGSWDRAYYEMGVFNSFMEFMLKFMTVIVITVGGFLAINGRMSTGELAAFILYISYFTSPLKRLISFFDQYQKGWSGFRRFFDMLQVEDEIKSGDLVFDKLESDIVFDNISFKYEDDYIVKDFNIEVKRNTSVALVGKTGVGKSTLAKLVPRFYDVNDGAILINNHNVKDYSLESLRSKIGYVEQDSYIFFGTILENIMYGRPDATFEEVREAAKKASLEEFIMTLEEGYDTQVGARGIKLSGGQKQRISLARMFLKNPEILVLDEATSALDNKTELLIQGSIEKLSENRTCLMIAHRLTTVENCDLIYVLGETGIIESGTHDELMNKKGEYYEMYISASF